MVRKPKGRNFGTLLLQSGPTVWRMAIVHFELNSNKCPWQPVFDPNKGVSRILVQISFGVQRLTYLLSTDSQSEIFIDIHRYSLSYSNIYSILLQTVALQYFGTHFSELTFDTKVLTLAGGRINEGLMTTFWF